MIRKEQGSMSDNSLYAAMEQRPVDSNLRHGPLHASGRIPVEGSAPVLVRELAMAHLVLRGTASNLSPGVKQVTDLDLPLTPLTSQARGDSCIRWISPDEWLLTLPEEGMLQAEEALREQCGEPVAIVNVSGGQTILILEGEHAIDVLVKSTSYDVHLRNFPVGKVVTTTFAQAQLVMRRLDKHRVELVVRRSFADYLSAWIHDAAAEFGIEYR
jgi:sarcosine oxidase subunit gamma